MKRRAFAFLAGLAAAGCSGSEITPPPDPAKGAAEAAAAAAAAVAGAVGSYTLTEVNGAKPPSTIYLDSDYRAEIARGSLVLRADRSYTETLVYVDTALLSGDVRSTTGVVNGTFALAGSQITFIWPSVNFSYTGAISNGVVAYTVDDHGTVYTLRYQRQ